MERAVFSDMLAERRRQLGYSIRQASRVLRLREDIIVAFEEGDFERMPKSGYAQGMLSSYARYLGLDASVVVEAYVKDFERYKREGHRGGASNAAMTLSGVDATSHVQPYVPSRGLLPTSGGPAGDMGSFATTRVRVRGASSSSEESRDSVADYTQVRPYTELAPQKVGASRRRVRSDESRPERTGTSTRTRSSRSRRDAQGQRLDTDSTRKGSSASARRVSGATGAKGGRGRSRQGNRGRKGVNIPPMAFTILGVVAIAGLAILVVLGVGSCTHREPTSSHTIPVSAADEASAEKNAQDASSSSTTTDTSNGADDPDGTNSSSGSNAVVPNKDGEGEDSPNAKEKETSVSVSVAADAVTWLEIDCDGVSEVAQTVTGPWQQTFTVEDAITIQAGDTTAVSVVRDGSQVQFESMASGIGTIRIQGTPSKKSTSKDDADAKGDDDRRDEDSSSSNQGEGYDGSEESSSDEYGDWGAYDEGYYGDDYSYGYDDGSYYEDESGYGQY